MPNPAPRHGQTFRVPPLIGALALVAALALVVNGICLVVWVSAPSIPEAMMASALALLALGLVTLAIAIRFAFGSTRIDGDRLVLRRPFSADLILPARDIVYFTVDLRGGGDGAANLLAAVMVRPDGGHLTKHYLPGFVTELSASKRSTQRIERRLEPLERWLEGF